MKRNKANKKQRKDTFMDRMRTRYQNRTTKAETDSIRAASHDFTRPCFLV